MSLSSGCTASIDEDIILSSKHAHDYSGIV